MPLELKQQLKLSQQLIMTPQLQQAIHLLQLSRTELVETVQRELMENPFLEEGDEEYPDQDENRLPEEGEAGYTEQKENRQEAQESRDSELVYDREAARSEDWEDYLGDFASTPRQMQPRDHEIPEEMSSLEGRLASHPTLESHLMWQLRLSSLTEEQKKLGEIIIGNLSSSGYLQATLEEMTEMARTNAQKEQHTPLPEVADMEKVLHAVQLFDPVGVAARDPQECLLIQIRSLGYDRDAVLMELVEKHLEDLEARRYKPLLRKFHLDMDELKEYLTLIQSLDPMPGSSFGEGEPTYITPDVFVYKINGEFVIVLNEEGLPNLHLSPIPEKAAEHASEKEKEYFSEKHRAASWLIKSLHQRQRTLYKVVESIVKHQKAFFEDGLTSLSPLILRDIAEDINMHESTVSRITTNKYVSTPYGVFELKFFFNSGLVMEDGNQVGSESVKAVIRRCISEEDPKKPLSDKQISEVLKEELKVTIARRTIAKYRIAMDIPSSAQRKEHF